MNGQHHYFILVICMSIILHYIVFILVEISGKLFFAITKISGILVVNIFIQLLKNF